MNSEMMEARNTQTKSKIAIKRGSSLQNKENIPNNNTSKKGVKKKAVIPPSGRNTLSNRKGNGAEEKPVIKTKRAKDAPDFSKLHKKWETKLAKGKAVTKRANTQIEPFNLTKDVDTKTEETDLNEELLEVDVDDHEQVEILHEESDTPTTHFKVPKSIRRPPVSCAKTKDKRVQFVEDPFDFKPDNNALQSILNNDGIRSTPSKRNTGVCCSPFNQKRTSIYYTGPRPDRPPTAFEKRLSMRRAAAVMAKMKLPEKNFQPSQTLVGVQEIGNKFTAVTSVQDSGNDFNTNDECIPEGASEDERTQCNDTVALVTGSSQHEVESEISWADTLKCYSQSEQENDSTVEDEEALIAQLEEEVRQTLSDIALTGQINPFPSYPTCKTEAEIVSIPLQQRRQKPSIYRKLFASPCNVQGGQAMTDRNVLIPQYSHPATSSNVNTPSLPCNSSAVKQGYPKKLVSTLMPESDDFPALPIDSTMCILASEENNTEERRTRIPLGKDITFSPLVTGGNPECKIVVQEHGMQNKSKIGTSDVCNGKEMSTSLSQQCLKTSASINNCFVKPGNGGVGHSDGTVIKGKFDRSTLQSLQASCGGNPLVTGSAFVTQNSRLRKNDLQGSGGAALGSPGIVESAFKEKESANNLSLVAAASASLNSKLKQKALETRSGFRMCAPNVQTTEHPTAANSYTQSNEKRILMVPTPVKPVVRRGELLDQETGSSQFISRHRQIMRDAMLKSRDHAHELLLDAEVSLYARNIDYVRKHDVGLRLVNPVAKLMSEGDEMHFVPVLA